jgi:predicted PurR-regulated permease PerM
MVDTVEVMQGTRREIMVAGAVAVAAGILGAQLLSGLFAELRYLLVLVGTALFLSLAMEPTVSALERRGWRRGVGAISVMLSAASVIGGMVGVGGAVLVSQADELLASLPQILEAAERELLSWGVEVDLSSLTGPGGVLENISTRLSESAIEASGKVLGGVGTALALSFFVFYLSADGPRLLRAVCSVLPAERQSHVYLAWRIAVEKAGGYIYARLVLALASSVAHTAAFYAVGVPYPIPLGIWAGVVSQAVPVLGAYLSGVLPAVVAIGVDTRTAVLSVLVVVAYQQVENLVLAPRITRNAVNVHPLAGFGSVLAGAATLGWVGAVFAVPVVATASSFLSAFVTRHDVVEEQPVPAPVARWRRDRIDRDD